MYKQQKPISLSSTVWALIVTALVLLIAASAHAQTPAPMNDPMPMPNATADAAGSSTIPNPPIPATSTAPAENGPATNVTANGVADTYQAAIAARRAALETKRVMLESASSTRRAVLTAATQTAIQNGVAAITVTLNQAVGRLREALEHLQSKTGELSAGQNSPAISSSLQSASSYLALAEEALGDADLNARYAATSDQPMIDWMDVRQQLTDVRALIQESQRSLRAAADGLAAALTLPPASDL